MAEIDHYPCGKTASTFPKKYKYSNTKDYLTFQKHSKIRALLAKPTEFGLEAEEASPQEILEATKEILARVEVTNKLFPESEELIHAYLSFRKNQVFVGLQSKRL
jgi:hypothetical protein